MEDFPAPAPAKSQWSTPAPAPAILGLPGPGQNPAPGRPLNTLELNGLFQTYTNVTLESNAIFQK